METTVEATDKHTVKLTIQVPVEEFDKDLARTYRAIGNSIKVPGFRKGKIPKQIIDTQVGEEVVLEEFVHQQVPAYFRTAVGDEDLAPITEPDVDVEQLEKGKPFIFTATVEVRPRLTLTAQDYEGLKVERPSAAVSETDIDEYIDRLRERFSELEPAERPIQDGDFATVDVKAEVDGEPLDDATRTDYLYFVGSGEFGEQLDAQLPGKKPGDIVTTTEELPERAGDQAGKPVSFTVLIKDVKARVLPDADDEFAKTASEFDTIAQLRDDLRERLGEVKERENTKIIRDRALQAMVDKVEEEIPETLIEDETTHRVTHAGERAKQMGITLEQMLEIQGWDMDRLRQDSRDHAVRSIKADLVLEGVARTAELEVTAEEIGAEINLLAQAYGRDAKEFAKQLDRSGEIVTLAGDIIRTKALDLLVEHADIQPESESTQEPELTGSSKETG
ncbi:MAG: trigger factor [Actinomycetota bacterium]|jgi:trigger factor|nr:trigger factor [Actinomycetota bacterium]